ncbi:PAAR domain-containing protein [Metapseudomonas otitidis]|uniref:PAAR domain-containing protein n=1 Tax=Metapseudomonas otitidis TaxID=319939 RepID=UPI001AAE4B3E|nr:PAAR domain-containing protein [Pseudomonas otitidis]MBO2927705.1 PAAR domain-containing protein [Pseudomonas otitidis]
MDAQAAARLGDEIAHGFGLAAMVAGAVAGALIGAAVIAATAATGGVALAVMAGSIAAGGLSMFQVVKGLSTIFNLPEPTTGVLIRGSPNVFVNARNAMRAGEDAASSCSGLPCSHPYWPFEVVIAEGSATVYINGKPAARLTSKMSCGAHIKTGSENTFIGGPTERVAFVLDIEGWVHSGLEILGLAALGVGLVVAAMAGLAVLATTVVIGGAMFAGMELLGQLGDRLGPGYRDLLQGVAGLALLGMGPKMAKLGAPKTPKTFEEVYAKAPAAKAEIDAVADALAAKHQGTVAKAPIKSRERALQKVNEHYRGDATQIKDLARNTVIVPKEKVATVAAELKEMGAKVKVIDGAEDPLGYSGINATMKTKAGITAEIQVNSPEMIYAKESEPLARQLLGDEVYNAVAEKAGVPGGKGHKYYEDWRVLGSDSPEAQAIAEQSRAYYEAVRNSSGN